MSVSPSPATWPRRWRWESCSWADSSFSSTHRLQARVRRRILALNADLERQVRERTAELEASTDQLRQRTEEAMAANRAKTEIPRQT